MSIAFAKAVSFLLGPLFVLLPIPYILVGKFTQNYYYALKWTVFSYGFILAVALFVIIGVFLGVFSNFDVSKKEQRPLLFSFSAFAIFCYLLSLFILDGPKILFVALAGIVLGLIIIVFVNKWIKASIHVASLTSVVLFIGIIYQGYYFLLLFLIPFLAWARIKTKEHTLMETVVGGILGILLTLIMYITTKQFFFGMIYN